MEKMDKAKQIQILNEVVYISHSVNPIYQPLRLGRIWHKVNF